MNHFQSLIAVLQFIASVMYIAQGKWLMASLIFTYGVGNVLLLFIGAK